VLHGVDEDAEPSDDNNDSVCHVCELAGDLICCEGDCLRSFHPDCLPEVPPDTDDQFFCEECEKKDHECSFCLRIIAKTPTFKCADKLCGRFYHLGCMQEMHGTEIPEAEAGNVFCPLHTCATCDIRTQMSSSTRCTRCPVAYHLPCLPAGAVPRHQNHFTCAKHLLQEARKSDTSLNRNVNKCHVCLQDGSLRFCDGCTTAVHPGCLVDKNGYYGPMAGVEESWFCQACCAGKAPLICDVVWVKHSTFRWWPCQVTSVDLVPPAVMNVTHRDFDFPVYFFGSHNFNWVNNGHVIPWMSTYQDLMLLPPMKANFKKALSEIKLVEKEWRKLQFQFDAKNIAMNGPAPFEILEENDYVSEKPSSKVTEKCKCDEKGGTCSDFVCANWSRCVECDPKLCPMKGKCKNQRLQKREHASLSLMYHPNKHWGVKATSPIPTGGLITEYLGEVHTVSTWVPVLKSALSLNPPTWHVLGLSHELVLDATRKGGIARFLNHSCRPNAALQRWLDKDGRPRAGIFAKARIGAGEEVAIDYGKDVLEGMAPRPCFCGEEGCRKVVGGMYLKDLVNGVVDANMAGAAS